MSKHKIQIQNSKIISNLKVKNNYYKLVLNAPLIAKNALPGQFVEVKVSNNCEPLLRRPFSIHQASSAKIEILYEVVGPGTEILSKRKAGGNLNIIGPLGNGFDLKSGLRPHASGILVAGGMGVAPILFLAAKLAKQKPIVLIGGKTKDRILCEKEFKNLGCGVKIATDDGSRGFKGYVSSLLEKELKTHNSRSTTIYACGPRPMLKEVSRVAKKFNIPAQISLEEHMACGIGACLGCVVNTRQGYKRVCQEGPVFEAAQIIWE